MTVAYQPAPSDPAVEDLARVLREELTRVAFSIDSLIEKLDELEQRVAALEP